jgi:type IV secretion system protein VirB10
LALAIVVGAVRVFSNLIVVTFIQRHMKNLKSMFVLFAAPLFLASAYADEPKTLQLEEPVELSARKVQPFEVTSGTFISLVLLNADELMVSAQVSTNVYDYYQNVVIPRGSRLIGKEIRQVNDRHEVIWTGLQIPATVGTLRLDPPLQATMPDGSAGLVNFKAAALAGAVTNEPFIVPH